MCLIQVTHFQCGHTFEGRTRRCAAYHERRVAAAPTLCNFPLFRHHSTHTRTSQCPDTRRNNKEAPTMCSQACVQRLMDRQRKQEREELRQEQQKRERARAVARQYRAAKDKAEQWEAAVQQRARERQQELERERERERQTGRGQRSRGKPPVPPKDGSRGSTRRPMNARAAEIESTGFRFQNPWGNQAPGASPPRSYSPRNSSRYPSSRYSPGNSSRTSQTRHAPRSTSRNSPRYSPPTRPSPPRRPSPRGNNQNPNGRRSNPGSSGSDRRHQRRPPSHTSLRRNPARQQVRFRTPSPPHATHNAVVSRLSRVHPSPHPNFLPVEPYQNQNQNSHYPGPAQTRETQHQVRHQTRHYAKPQPTQPPPSVSPLTNSQGSNNSAMEVPVMLSPYVPSSHELKRGSCAVPPLRLTPKPSPQTGPGPKETVHIWRGNTEVPRAGPFEVKGATPAVAEKPKAQAPLYQRREQRYLQRQQQQVATGSSSGIPVPRPNPMFATRVPVVNTTGIGTGTGTGTQRRGQNGKQEDHIRRLNNHNHICNTNTSSNNSNSRSHRQGGNTRQNTPPNAPPNRPSNSKSPPAPAPAPVLAPKPVPAPLRLKTPYHLTKQENNKNNHPTASPGPGNSHGHDNTSNNNNNNTPTKTSHWYDSVNKRLHRMASHSSEESVEWVSADAAMVERGG